MTRWAILSGEYPPFPGGVSDYTQILANALTLAGDEVVVFTPGLPAGPIKAANGMEVYRLPDHFGPKSLFLLDKVLRKGTTPDRILIQYVPHAFGFKAMNLPFAIYVAARLRRIAPIWVMFHEVAFPFSWRPLKYAVLASAHRLMARLIAASADRIFVSIPAWEGILTRIYRGIGKMEWLPVPCNVSIAADVNSISAVRNRYMPDEGHLVGHFGSFGQGAGEVVEATVLELVGRSPKTSILLIGREGPAFRDQLISNHPNLQNKIDATGDLSAVSVSAHLRACDLLVQPFVDGVNSRRGRMMAGLANGVPVVSNLGIHSEPIWNERGLAVAPSADPIVIARMAGDLMERPANRRELAEKGLKLYREVFAIENTIAKLRCQIN